MGLDIDVDLSPFWWTWPEDDEVRVRIRPINPGMQNRAIDAAGVSANRDGLTRVGSSIPELAKIAFLEWEHVTHRGDPLRCDAEGIEKVAELFAPFLSDACAAGVDEYRRRVEARSDDTEGNSAEPQSG